jgi:hypothetical protein
MSASLGPVTLFFPTTDWLLLTPTHSVLYLIAFPSLCSNQTAVLISQVGFSILNQNGEIGLIYFMFSSQATCGLMRT